MRENFHAPGPHIASGLPSAPAQLLLAQSVRLSRPSEPIAKTAARAPPRARRVSIVRSLRVLGVAVLAVELLYLVGINVFLSTSLFENVVDGDPTTIDVHFARAWSLLPGSIHAERLSIRGRDSHVEWILRLDRVDFRVSFLGFLHKQFHVLSARGSGIAFRLRQRVESPRATPEYVAKLPPIAGLPTLAFAPDEPPGKDVWSDADYHLWTVNLEDLIAARVREIWIDTARFEGLARIAGGFYLKPIRTVAVGPVHVDVAPGGHVAVAGQPIAEELSGSFVFTLSALDPRVAKGADVLHHASLSTELRTDLPDPGGLPIWPDDMHVYGRVEARRVALRVVDGVVRDDTHVDVHGASLSATCAGHEVVGAIAITGDVTDRRLEFCVEGADVRALDFMNVHHVTACGDSAASTSRVRSPICTPSSMRPRWSCPTRAFSIRMCRAGRPSVSYLGARRRPCMSRSGLPRSAPRDARL